MAVAPGYRRRSAGTYGAYTAGSPLNRDAGSVAEPDGHKVSHGPWALVEGDGEILSDGSARLRETPSLRSLAATGVPPVPSASHEVPTRPAAGLLDGRPWATSTRPTGPIWARLSFNVPRTASRVVLRQEAGRDLWGAPAVWRLQGSKDGQAWADIVVRNSGEGLHRAGAEEVVDFTAARYQHWRVLVDSYVGTAVEIGAFELYEVIGYTTAAGPATFDTADLSLQMVDRILVCAPVRERRPGDAIRWSASFDGGETWPVSEVTAEDLMDRTPGAAAGRVAVRFRVTMWRDAMNERSPVAGPVNLNLRLKEFVDVPAARGIPLLGATAIAFPDVTPDAEVRVEFGGSGPVLWRDPRWVPVPADHPGLNLGEDLNRRHRIPEGATVVHVECDHHLTVRLCKDA